MFNLNQMLLAFVAHEIFALNEERQSWDYSLLERVGRIVVVIRKRKR